MNMTNVYDYCLLSQCSGVGKISHMLPPSVTYFGHRIDEYVWATSNCRNVMRQAGMQAGRQ